MNTKYRKMIQGLETKAAGKRKGRSHTRERWYLYMLRCADGSLYTGITNDVEKRFATHQSGKGARFTRTRLPVELVYREICATRSAALIREFRVKSLARPKKEELISALFSRSSKKRKLPIN